MENKKFTKRAVLTSVIAVLLCCALLVGGTFAWFTDTATTGINTIESGNLDLELYYATQADVVDGTIAEDAWKVVSTDEAVFNEKALWEPGYTEVVYFKVANVGNLSLKYRMGVEIFNEKSSTNKYGAEFKLSDYIYAYRNDAPSFSAIDSREQAQDPLGDWGAFLPYEIGTPLSQAVQGGFNGEDGVSDVNSLNTAVWLEPEEVFYTTLVLWMPEEVGNEANYLEHEDVEAPQIQLGVSVTATQYNWEEEFDSFDHNYDENAQYPTLPTLVNTAEALAEALANAEPGDVIALAPNTAYGTVTLGDLEGVTITGAEGSPLIVKTDADTSIKDVTLSGIEFVYTGATADCGVVVNADAEIENLVIENCTFTGTGAKAGRGISGLNNTASIELVNCTFKDLGYPIYAWGGYESLVVEGCTFENIKSWAIMPQSGFNGDLTVNGCTFTNCLGGGLIKAGTLTAGHTFTFTNNEINGCTVAGDHNWFQFNVSAGTSVVSGNTKDGAAWTPTAADGLK